MTPLRLAALLAPLVLPACEPLLVAQPPVAAPEAAPAPPARPGTAAEAQAVVAAAGRSRPVPRGARTVDAFDTTTEAERAVAVAAPPAAAEVALGTTVASLGDPADPGLWLATPLVVEARPGRLRYAATGQSVLVELRPIAGPATAGSRISLPAIRLLGAPLAGLPEIEVFGL